MQLFDINVFNDQQKKVISDCFMIAIRCDHKCNCYSSIESLDVINSIRPTEYYYYRSSTEITVGDLIKTLIKEEYSPCIIHNQLYGFTVNDTGAEAKA